MSDPKTIKQAFERNQKALKLKPSKGQSTSVTKIRIRDGTTCDIEHGDWKLTCDVGRHQGGNDAGPGPGILERAALGSCLAIGYSSWAAVWGIPVDSLEVEVETDWNAMAAFGLSDDPPGWQAIRYRVIIQSSAPEKEILAMLDEADRHSPVRDDFARAIPIEREVKLVMNHES